MAHTYPPVAFPPPPPTSNALSSHERAALIRSSKKLSKVLGDVPRVLDDTPSILSGPELTRTTTGVSITEAAWRKRKPTHIPPIPILKLAASEPVAPESPRSPYRRPPSCRSSVLSVLSDAPSIVSNAPLIGSDAPSTSNSQRRSKLERLRRKLGNEVPVTAVFPTALPTALPSSSSSPLPPTPRASASRSRSRSRTRSVHHRPDDARSLAFSISSDESVHTVTFTSTHVRAHSPHSSKTQPKNVYHTGALPPVPPIPAHFLSGSKPTSRHDDHDDAGLIRPRQKMGAGSKFGGSDFKAARRAKREGKSLNGPMAAPGEMVEMVGFL